jgi:sigma-B regulation protein RsbU (phosphoserine phosphatase)
LIYTDGVTEACSEAGELFTEARLDKLLSGMENTNVKGAVEAVFQDVHDFEGDTKQADDITVLAMQRR